MNTRIAVIGEALVDIVADGEAHVGGSPLNVAVGLGRLGLSSYLHTRIGRDHYGEMITRKLSDEGVTVPAGSIIDGRTSTATVTLDSEGTASYEFDLTWTLSELGAQIVPDASVVHTGSIGAVLEPGGTVARSIVGSAPPGVLRSYDPNARPDIMGDADKARTAIRTLASSCHVVKFSDEDAEWIGGDTGATPDEVLASIAASGPRFTVMTRGAHGCTAIVDGETYEHPGREVTVADTIGAGDAFMSGLLFALVRDGSDRVLVEGKELSADLVDSALDTAMSCATIAVSRSGAEPPHAIDLSRS
ncbi:MAG TPA: carbohydrate kinase [Candidatus Corynebacterium avicola]|uniref:Carbohydrate kinase n=1 Tax=Candidatus Corynebacterium avicola TaxID=2838527 RepID=A0A9D1UJX4_9CORY|nr:carbohydrate kinase [Candidatus Corynebacterium avicola]